MKINHFEKSFLGRRFTTVMKIQHWWQFITVIIYHHCDENAELWLNVIDRIKFNTMMEVYHFDKTILIWQKFVTLMKIQQQLVNSSNLWNSSQWWKFIKQIASIWLYLNNSDLLCFALNSHFLIFPGGVGGWGGANQDWRPSQPGLSWNLGWAWQKQSLSLPWKSTATSKQF